MEVKQSIAIVLFNVKKITVDYVTTDMNQKLGEISRLKL